MYGWHTVQAALTNPARECLCLCVSPESAQKVERLPRAAALETQVLSPSQWQFLPTWAVHQGIALLVAPIVMEHLDPFLSRVFALSSGRRPMVVVLDGVTDPRNVGAVIRSAAAFGVAGLIVPKRSSALESGVLAKAASGALEIVPIVSVINLSRTLKALAEKDFWLVSLEAEAEKDLLTADRPETPLALLLGSEEKGARPLVRRHCDLAARIPLQSLPGAPSSLNVSAAASAAFALLRAGA